MYRSLVWLVMGSWRNEESMPKESEEGKEGLRLYPPGVLPCLPPAGGTVGAHACSVGRV